MVLDDPTVSARHAEVVRSGSRAELRDLDTKTGTRLNGQLIKRAEIDAGAEIGIGPFRLAFDGQRLQRRDADGGLRLVAREVAVDVRGQQLLRPTSLVFEPGEFVAIIGESGSGKSTLIKALAGVSAPSAGSVEVGGEPVHVLLAQIGYVPQDEIVHPLLSAAEALAYAARLRLPDDPSEADVNSIVVRVLAEVELENRAGTRIASLSGGQRKRVGVATELVHLPGLLFLDEPTSGLDPGLETHLMSLLRSLARKPRTVVAIVHATKNLRLCDKVAVLGRGGGLCFYGPPDEALRHFEVDDFDGIYATLEKDPDSWYAKALSGSKVQDSTAAGTQTAPAASAAIPRPSLGASAAIVARQALILTERYIRLFARDRRNLLILLGQAPLTALGIMALFHHNVLERIGGDPTGAVEMLYLVELTIIWLGSIDASREIIKERAVFLRERAVGVRTSAYLLSKWLVLFPLLLLQALLVAAIVFAFRPPHEAAGAVLAVFGTLALTGFGAVALGLLVSSFSRTEDQATSFIPLLIIPQLLFAGAIVPLHKMSQIVSVLAGFMSSRWTLASIGTSLDLNARFASRPGLASASGYGTSFFDISQLLANLILLGFFALFTAGLLTVLRRMSE